MQLHGSARGRISQRVAARLWPLASFIHSPPWLGNPPPRHQGSAWHPSSSTLQRLTPRSTGAPTAAHQRPAGGTQYIFTARALAFHRCRPVTSNVRPHTNTQRALPSIAPTSAACRRQFRPRGTPRSTGQSAASARHRRSCPSALAGSTISVRNSGNYGLGSRDVIQSSALQKQSEFIAYPQSSLRLPSAETGSSSPNL